MSEAEGLAGAASDAGAGVLARALSFKRRVRAGEVVTGAWVSLADPATTEIMGRIGFDFLLYDTEHSPWNLDQVQAALMALNGTDTMPFVRVPWNDHVHIKQMLDMGVEGILAPMVRTVEECKALVCGLPLPAVGARGFGPTARLELYRDINTYIAAANEAVCVMPRIEDIATVGLLDDYLAVPEIDAVCIGPNDLSGTAGLLRQKDHPTVKTALETIVTKASARKLPICLGINTAPEKYEKGSGARRPSDAGDLRSGTTCAGGGKAALTAAQKAMKG